MGRGSDSQQILPEATTLAPNGILFVAGVRESSHLDEELTGILNEKGEMATIPAPKVLRYPARTLLLLGGVPAVGKSTLANRLLSDQHVIELDKFLDGEAPNFTFRYQDFYDAIRAALGDHSTVIVHMTGLRGPLRRRVARIAEQQGAVPHAIFLDGDEELTRAGQLARQPERDYIPDSVMAEYHENWEYEKFFLRARNTNEEDRQDREMGEWQSVTVLGRDAVNALDAILFV